MRVYPWYEIVEGENLQQGDILWRCPVIVPKVNLTENRIIANLDDFDVIVMTHSCDLLQEKTTEVLLCPHWDLQEAMKMDRSLDKGKVKQILKGQVYRYSLLAASDILECPMGIRIVDFGRVFSLPKVFVQQLAAKQGKRLRLCPPYREHLAQAFARFFMRVGLPQEIELPDYLK
ncbi:MAG: hypothetical protein N3B10_14550 [Armatimonadetes bacterium]|nr:hypothetical protein [Armatimonadota bacterium]